MQGIRKANLFTSLLPQQLYRVNLICKNHLLKGMLIFLLLWKPNWTLPFLSLSLWWMVKVKHISLTETETKMGSCLFLRRHTRQICRNIYEKSEFENKYTKERKNKKQNLIKHKRISVMSYTKRRIKNMIKGFI